MRTADSVEKAASGMPFHIDRLNRSTVKTTTEPTEKTERGYIFTLF